MIKAVPALAIVTVVLALTACAGNGDGDSSPRAAGGTAVSPPAGPPPADVVEGCGDRVESASDAAPVDAVRAGPLALDLTGYESQPASDFTQTPSEIRDYLDGRPGRGLGSGERRRLERTARLGRSLHSVLKVGAVLRAGTVATVAIAPADRRHASLLYRPRRGGASGLFDVSDGVSVVKFVACHRHTDPAAARRECHWTPDTACTGSDTAFVGGWIVDGPRCVTLQVWEGTEPAPLRRRVGFGVPC